MANRITNGPKPARKRQPATKRAKPQTAGEKSAPAAGGRTTPAAQTTTISVEERNRLIAEEAYFIAEQRGFTEGRELEDWLEAEAIVNARLKRKVV